MRYGSVCSGIEAATMAWHPLGWSPAFFAEIEKFPSQVLAHHYGSNMPGEDPSANGVPNLGDISKFQEWPDATIDLLVGGTPCQAFSVAGLRKGLADPRGNLSLTYLGIVDRYRPRWCVWENVPGVLSSASHVGSDPRTPEDPVDLECDGQEVDTEIEYDAEEVHAFNSFLAGLSELGYGVAYRVLDAQYVRVDGFGRAVPQRRRRVFVVGYLGDWRRAAAVFFEPESLSGNTAPRREPGQRVAPTISARPTGGGGLGTDFDLDGGLVSDAVQSRAFGGGNCSGSIDVAASLAAHGVRQDFEVETFVAQPLLAKANSSHDDSKETYIATRDVAATLTRGAESSGKGGYAGRRQEDDDNLVAIPYTLAIRGRDGEPDLEYRQDGTANAILTPNGGRAGIGVGAVAIQAGAMRENPDSGPDGVGVQADIAYTLEARAEVQAVQERWAVRRLMPVECERLQGFPDGFTDIMPNGKPTADGPRYKALGNSMAVNVMRWIGQRIEMVDRISPFQASEAA